MTIPHEERFRDAFEKRRDTAKLRVCRLFYSRDDDEISPRFEVVRGSDFENGYCVQVRTKYKT